MNDKERLNEMKAEIADAITKRYASRASEREPRLAEARRVGPIAAAPAAEKIVRAGHLTPIEARNLEATTGNYDIDQINFLSRGLKASRAVCRIVSSGTSWGTGFLVAPGFLLTNNHVLPDMESSESVEAEFGFEYNENDQAVTRKRCILDPHTLFITSPEKKLDFTIVALAPGTEVSELYGWLPLNPREHKIMEGEPAIVIQHPGQEDKKICLFDSTLVDRLTGEEEPYLHYTTDTEKGSSGAPVFNRSWQIIALHHGNVELTELDPTTKKPKKIVVNEGVRISRIISALRSGKDLQSEDSTQFAVALDRLLSPEHQVDSRPQGPTVESPIASSPTESSIPKKLIRVTPVGAAFEGEGQRTIIKRPPLSHYAGRQGYNDNFLGTGVLAVPLPNLSPAMHSDIAPLLSSNSSHVLKYTHYSVIMCASRRVAYFSAVNIAGKTNPNSFDRKKRVVFEGTRDIVDLEKAADTWYYDPRISQDYQPSPELFDDAKTRFDFGHITRRMDAVWGTSEQEKLLGSDDTFHMTNCSPQVSSYNQHGDWGSLEDAISKFARGTDGSEDARKVTVISGPVLHPSDRKILGVFVPSAFWKVIAFEQNGQLASLAFLTSQRELVEEEARKLESTKVLVQNAFDNEWLSTVQDISRLTSLDFGPLKGADLFAGQGGHRERITQSLLNQIFGS